MNAEAIISSMNFLDDDLLSEAGNRRNRKEKKKKFLKPAITIAACFALVFASILGYITLSNPNLAKLSADYSMGYEGHALDNTDEFECGYPANNRFITMPVYTDNCHDEKGTPAALTEIQLEERLQKASDLTGISIENKTKSYANDLYGGYEKDFVYNITSESAHGTIIVNAAGGVTAVFSKPHKLDYEFDPTTKESREKALEHYSETFSDFISAFISFKEPTFITSREMLADCSYVYLYRAYDSSGNSKNDILKSNLQYAEFRIDDSGNLYWIHISDSLISSEKNGNYPVKSENTARKELLEGEYFSNVPYDIKGEDFIIKSELIYKSNGDAFIPCYKFLVELPDAPPNPKYKTYGIFYVCAIKDKYIK